MLGSVEKTIVGLLSSLLVQAIPERARGFEAGLGLIAMEEGDDRHHPGIFLRTSHDIYDGRLCYYSRRFGPVFQSVTLVAFAGSLPVPVLPWLTARAGVAVLRETTVITYKPIHDGFNRSERHYNAGLVLGLRASGHIGSYFYFEGGWDSHLFPAGLIGGLFLATGRKQVIYFGSGVRW